MDLELRDDHLVGIPVMYEAKPDAHFSSQEAIGLSPHLSTLLSGYLQGTLLSLN
jgi:hypothetical protein